VPKNFGKIGIFYLVNTLVFLTLSISDGFPAAIFTITGRFWWEIQMLFASAKGRYF